MTEEVLSLRIEIRINGEAGDERTSAFFTMIKRASSARHLQLAHSVCVCCVEVNQRNISH